MREENDNNPETNPKNEVSSTILDGLKLTGPLVIRGGIMFFASKGLRHILDELVYTNVHVPEKLSSRLQYELAKGLIQMAVVDLIGRTVDNRIDRVISAHKICEAVAEKISDQPTTEDNI